MSIRKLISRVGLGLGVVLAIYFCNRVLHLNLVYSTLLVAGVCGLVIIIRMIERDLPG